MPKKQPITATVIPHTGTIIWIGVDGGEEHGVLMQAILRSEREIAIDCQCDGNVYTMVLKSIDGIVFSGECRGRWKDLTWLPVVNFKRWTNQKGSLLLGKWIEDGDESYCVIELFSRMKKPTKRMQATARMTSVVSSTHPARHRLIRNVRPTSKRSP